jgi:hypothetical protein
LQILVNAVQIWNARHIDAAVQHLTTTQPQQPIDDEALTRIAPVHHAHINPVGRYDLNRQPAPAGQLRPLRTTQPDDQRTPAPPLGVNGDKH